MTECDRIAAELRRMYDRQPWHGPSVTAALQDVDVQTATARVLPGRHTICEIVLHMTAWTREVTRRLRDNVARDPEDGDWPQATVANEAEWQAVCERLGAANAELVAAIRALGDERLHDAIGDARDRTVGGGVPVYVTLHGLVQHHAYHAGQIVLLKRP
jgi:uncharacterized damage-inducible protein DinB